ncbi:hypothetical protein Ccrd_021761 [Cynara cardunculus var. scolymus]|uniref:Uncharacterized protein n=1 Tax=Cynara cardunculus var. scolymus TaxID=59895 RepID=A0A124SEG1_CYNCS|nr:hypothetical protein Ccrd_021761 [Cynara cardunculus var. scolymus]
MALSIFPERINSIKAILDDMKTQMVEEENTIRTKDQTMAELALLIPPLKENLQEAMDKAISAISQWEEIKMIAALFCEGSEKARKIKEVFSGGIESLVRLATEFSGNSETTLSNINSEAVKHSSALAELIKEASVKVGDILDDLQNGVKDEYEENLN